TTITCEVGSSATLNVSGEATCLVTYDSTSGSPHAITAEYSGDANYNTSTSNQVDQAVDPADSSTALVSSANPSVVGDQVTYTATVSGPGTLPTGSVVFKDGVTTITCEVGSSSTSHVWGEATCLVTYDSTSGSPHAITAEYSGDANYNTSTSNQVD